jgi:hypothetical protein
MIVNQLLMFQRSTHDDAIHQRAGGDTNALSLVLAEIGCLACRYEEDFELALTLQLEEDGKHVADIIYARATNAKWPWGVKKKQA